MSNGATHHPPSPYVPVRTLAAVILDLRWLGSFMALIDDIALGQVAGKAAEPS